MLQVVKKNLDYGIETTKEIIFYDRKYEQQ